MSPKKMLAPVVAAAALAVCVPAAQAEDPVSVCNEAENSPRGGYVLVEPATDSTPPAFHRGSPMAIGDGAGVERAADKSPALHRCMPEGDGGGGGGGGES